MTTVIVASLGLGASVFALTGNADLGRRAGLGLFGACALLHAAQEAYYRFAVTAPRGSDE